MFAILSGIIAFISKIAKWLIVLSFAVVLLGLITWAIPNVLGFSEFIPVPIKSFLALFVVIGVCKVVLHR